jgi:hypothetical protein
MFRLRVLAAAAVALVCGALASSVAAAPSASALASVTAETPISAGGGWLLWSVPVSGGWGLEAFHEGRTEPLPVAPRPQPFDASVGTDAHGAAVATFSRCHHTPTMRDVGETQALGGSLVEPQSGAGCRIHVLELASGRESQPPIPDPAGASDTTPSMWRGSVVFARKAPGHGDVWQVMLWSPVHPRSLATLRHGAIPPRCPAERDGCRVRPAHGEVEALDRDGGLVTFLWAESGPGVFGEGAWEVRVDNLATGRSSLAAAGFGHEACTGPPIGLEYIWPEAPVAAGHLALFPQLQGYACFKRFASVLDSYQPGAKHASSGDLADITLGLANEGSVIYGLVPPPAEPGADSPSCSVAAPCTLEQLTEPLLSAETGTPMPPFE